MSEEHKSNWQRFAASIARIIVRLWPKETQAWGRAFEAELPEIETPFASLRWLTGGLMLLTRERFRHFLKSLSRPIGVPAPDPSSALSAGSGPALRSPRFLTALFLIVCVTFLCFSEVRTSLASVLSSGVRTIANWDPQQWNSVRKLHKEAQTNRDPQLLAFLSLLAQEPEERMRLAEEAIEKDPSLTWVDYAGSYWNYADADRRHFLSDERIARLQKSDPQNAVPLLLTAEAIRHPVEQAYWADGKITSALETPGWVREIGKNGDWLLAMDRAFTASKFDTYLAHKFDLLRVVSNRFHLSDTDIAPPILFAHSLADYEDIDAYSDLLLERGEEAARRGDRALAAADFEKVERFAQCMRAGSTLSGDPWVAGLAASNGTKSSKKLKSLFESSGQTAQAQLVAAQLEGWQGLETRLRARPQPWFERHWSHWSRPERAALLINLAVLLISFFSPIALLALLSLGFAASSTRRILGRLYRLVCLAADAAPIFLASSFALLFFAYHPYAKAYKTYLASTGQMPANPEDIVIAAGVTHMLPWSVQTTLNETIDAYHLWLVITLVLTAVAVWLIFRMIVRRQPA
jgi:hypothetical protein